MSSGTSKPTLYERLGGEVAPARVAMQRLDPGDFHPRSSPAVPPGPPALRGRRRISVTKCGIGVPAFRPARLRRAGTSFAELDAARDHSG